MKLKKFLKENKELQIFFWIGLAILILYSIFFLVFAIIETLMGLAFLGAVCYGAYRYNRWLRRTREEPHTKPFGSN